MVLRTQTRRVDSGDQGRACDTANGTTGKCPVKRNATLSEGLDVGRLRAKVVKMLQVMFGIILRHDPEKIGSIGGDEFAATQQKQKGYSPNEMTHETLAQKMIGFGFQFDNI